MSKIVLVTGAFGNVGSVLITILLEQGYHIIAFDKYSKATAKQAKAFSHSNITIKWGDITDRLSIAEAIKNVEVVIHLAAIFPPLSENNPALTTQVNVCGTRYLIELMQASDTAKRLIFASSIGVYGKQQDNNSPPLDINTAIAPDDVYGKSKAGCEEMIRQSHLQFTILRLSPCPPISIKAIASFKNQAIFEHHPDSRLELIHSADAALAFANSIFCDESIGQTLLLGGGKNNQIRYYQMLSMMFSTLGIGALPRAACKISPEIHFHGDWLDTTLSQQLLQYQRYDIQRIYDDFVNSFGITKYIFTVVKCFSPLIRPLLLRRSFYYQQKTDRSFIE